jgi:PKD repeat protein
MKKSNLKRDINILLLMFFAMSVKSFAQPLAANAGTNTSVCNGSAITIGGSPSASYGNPPYTYSWSPATGLSSSTVANPSASPSGTTTYTLTVTDAISNVASAAITVSVNALPSATATNNGPVCTGASINLAAASVAGATYSWTGPSGYTAAVQNPFISNASAANAGVYTLYVTVNGCTNSTTTSVVVNANPTVNAGPDQSVCLGAALTFSSISNGSTFSWNFGDGGTANTLSPTHTYLSAGTYTATFTGISSSGCSASDNVIVTVNNNPTLSHTVNNVTCNGACDGTITSTVTGGAPSYTYLWAPGSMTTSSVSGLCAGSYTVYVTDANGCTANMGATVSQPTALSVTSSSTNVTCFGACNGTASVLAGGGTPSYSYVWSPFVSSGQGTANASGLCAGTYTATVTDASGCVMTSTVVITEPTPLVTSASAAQTICNGDTATFTSTSTGGTPPYSFNWNDGTSNYSGPVLLNSPAVNTSYTLTTTDANGCMTTDYTSATVLPLSDIDGHVSYSGGNLNAGNTTAVLYQYSLFLTSFDTVMVSPLNASGNYHFSGIPNGDYIIKIFNDTAAYPLVLPTYFGNEFLWDSASVISHQCGINDTADIVMQEVPMITGPGVISGTITEGLGFSRVPGEPIPGIDIKLGRNPGGQLVASTQTGAGASAGQYTFTDVPLNLTGENYTIYVDIPGLGRISTYSFVVDAGHTQYPGLDYEADSTSVYITQTSVGINNVTTTTDRFNVYPNPARDNINIEYTIDTETNIELSVFNVMGEKISQIENKKQSTGTYKYNLDTEHIGAGIYFIKLNTGKKTTVKKIIITE